MKKFLAFLLPTILCFLVGWVSAWIQTDALEEWYPYLVKSVATPPNILFPIAWSILYILIGISAGLVITTPSQQWHTTLLLWFLQLLLNFLWSFLFFAMRSPLLALIDIVLLGIVITIYIITSSTINRAAAWLFAPYLCWVLFATYLNGYILMYN